MSASSALTSAFPARAVRYAHRERFYVGSCPMVEDGRRYAFPAGTGAIGSSGREIWATLGRAVGLA